MPDLAMGSVAEGAVTWLLTYLLHSTVVVGVVWLLVQTGWVRRPTTQDLLWKVALTAALATTSLALWSPFPQPARTLDVQVRASASEGVPRWQGDPPAGASVIRVRAMAADPSPACLDALGGLRGDPGSDARLLRRACLPPEGPGWRGLLVATWLLVGTGLLVRMLLGQREVGRSLGGALPAAPGVRAMAGEILGPSSVPPDVVVAQEADAPCVVAGRIVLPARCMGSLTPDEIRAALAHEVAHLVRRDPAWIALGEVVCRLLWVQPLNRVALAGLRGSAELACDDWAVERTRRPLDLAHSIARVAQWLQAGRRTPAWGHVPQLARLAPGEGHALSARVRRILTPGAPRRSAPRPIRLLLAALVMAPTLALPAVPARGPTMALYIRQEVDAGVPLTSPDPIRAGVVVLVRDAPAAGS